MNFIEHWQISSAKWTHFAFQVLHSIEASPYRCTSESLVNTCVDVFNTTTGGQSSPGLRVTVFAAILISIFSFYSSPESKFDLPLFKVSVECNVPVNKSSVDWLLAQMIQSGDVQKLLASGSGDLTINSTNTNLLALPVPVKRILLYSLSRSLLRDSSVFGPFLMGEINLAGDTDMPPMFFVYRCIQLLYDDKHRIYAAAV
jgi:hypothetical protein